MFDPNDPDLPEFRISEEEFKRLPLEMQKTTHQSWMEHAERKRAQRKNFAERRRNAAIFAGFASGILGILVPGAWSLPVILAITSAAAAALIVQYSLSLYAGMIAYGAQAIFVSALFANIFSGSDSGGWGGGFAGGIMMSTWVLHLIIGFAIGKMSENRG